MSWENLPTNYTDAVFSGLRKYQQINNDDGTVSFQDVTVYQNQENSFFGANDANRMNTAINQLMNSEPQPENDVVLLWQGSFSFGNPITLSESAFNFMQLWILTNSGITLIGVPSPTGSGSYFTAIATGPFAGAKATVYGFSAFLLENGITLRNPFCYSQEIGSSVNSPETPTAIYGVGRRNITIDPVLAHNNSLITHLNMIVDGNNSDVTDASSSLQEHIVSPQAHQNLIIDGNEN